MSYMLSAAPQTGNSLHLLCGGAERQQQLQTIEKRWFFFYLNKTSAAPDLKNEKAQRSAYDVTP